VLSTADRDYVVPTTCKTWGCPACNNKVRQLTAMKMMYGCLSTGGPSHFITVTYRKRPGDRTRNAKDVAEDWAALWRRLKELEAWKEAAWLKVPELTKKGQVHLHAIAVQARSKDSCRKRDKDRKAWMQRPCSGRCLEHDLAAAWYDITGDSFVVDCSEIRSVTGTASYVQKYMSKMFPKDRATLKSLGFAKRWTASKDWPRVAPLRLLGTELGAWEFVTRVHGAKATYAVHSEDVPVPMVDMAEDQELEAPVYLQHVGDEYLLALRHLAEKRSAVKDVMKGLGIAI